MHFVGIGHSHVVALAKGTYALQVRGDQRPGGAVSCRFHYLYDPVYEPPFVGGGLNGAILRAISEGAPRFVLASIGGNEHNVLSISQRDGKFDFLLGENLDLSCDPRAALIPESAVRETLCHYLEDKMLILRAIRAATDAPVVQIEPPPPVPREQVLAYPKEFFASILDRRNLAPDLLRYKVWRVQCGLMRQICADYGVMYVETPANMIDVPGMMARHAWGADATHANEVYGEAMINRALDCVAGHPSTGERPA